MADSATDARWLALGPDDAAALLAGVDFRWWIAGGIALELFTGDSWRTHEDLDVGVTRSEAPLIYSWFAGWDPYLANAGQLTPWLGRPLLAETNENNVWLRRTSRDPWSLDINIGDGNDGQWVYRRDPRLQLPWHEAVRRTPAGIPYLAPHLQVLFKSKHPRPKDRVDAERVIPHLSASEHAFLREHLDSHHEWLSLLESKPTFTDS